MPTSLPLDTLTHLARDQLEQATLALGQSQQNLLAARQQLEMLETYLHDYRVRLQDAVQHGLSAAGWQNYQRFITTLESAIAEQRAVVLQAETRLAAGRGAWQDCQQRMNSFDTLRTRRTQAQAIVANRREQQASDEFSARLVQRRVARRSMT